MTTLITAQNITKSYGSQPLFSDISLTINTNDHIGLIGPNGSGKSTLLKILMGIESEDSGKVAQQQNAHILYLPQEEHFEPEMTIKEILFSDQANLLTIEECHHQLRSVIGETIFSDLNQKVLSLSGGWRKKLAIVQVLLQKPDLLLLDEPTNHLDLAGILWLESLLKKANFAFVVISHDRYFLNNICQTIIELNAIFPQGYFKSTGSYYQFMEKRAQFIHEQLRTEQVLSNKLRREEEWLSRMPKARTTKAQYRIEQAKQLKSDLEKVSYNNRQNKPVAIDFTATGRKTKVLLEAQHLKITRQDKLLFSDLNMILSPGDCLGILGQNGSGKSTLIHLLKGDLTPEAGQIKCAENLRIVLFDQKRAQLDRSQTLMRALVPAGDSVVYQGQLLHVMAWAKRLGFEPEQLQQSVASLSGGEQARLLISQLMLQNADILLLDEPTNDLDIPTLEILEESLLEFAGAIVLITHDRFLLDRLSDRLLYLDGQGKAQYYADYAQWQNAMTQQLSTQNTAPIQSPTLKKSKSLSYDEQRELDRIPAKIQKAETEIKAIEEQLHHPDISHNLARINEIYAQITTLQTKIEQFYQRWEELEQKKD